MTHTEIVSFIWDVANLIRDSFKRGKYQDVILPLTVLRRLDCVLAPTKEKVLARNAELKELGLEDRRRQLERASGFAFYNTSRYDFDRLLADAPEAAANLRNNIAGFSANMREVVERFDFDNTISKLDEAGLLFQVLERFREVDLHPDIVDNPTMGTIFEELIRRFNEALDENPGEHFTPRDVVHLMVDLMLAGDGARISGAGVVRSVYDPCCGSGGMLMLAKEHIIHGRTANGTVLRTAINPEAEIHLFGQEVNPETWALSKSDFFMKDPTGRDARKITFGSTLSNDRHSDRHFDYLIANPPYGKDWKRDKAAVKAEHERGAAGRFGPGLPRISDGQTLFLLHMLARAMPPKEGGARPASPVKSGEQNIDMESYRLQQTGSGGIELSTRAGILDPRTTGIHQGGTQDEVEPLSRIIAELNERFGIELGPEHRVTLQQMMERLEEDRALDAAARVNTRENVRLTFDNKVEEVIQDIVDSNFDLYKRITDDEVFGELVKTLMFDQYLRTHRNPEALIEQGESKTLEFKSTLRWNLKEDRKDNRMTFAALKTIAAFLNTEGGDLLIGVADDGSVVGIERDRLDNDDKFMLHLVQLVRNALGDRAGTCVDPKTQELEGGTVCVVSCQRSPEPVFLRWKGMEKTAEGDFFVRSGPGTVKLEPESAKRYVATRFGTARAQSAIFFRSG